MRTIAGHIQYCFMLQCCTINDSKSYLSILYTLIGYFFNILFHSRIPTTITYTDVKIIIFLRGMIITIILLCSGLVRGGVYNVTYNIHITQLDSRARDSPRTVSSPKFGNGVRAIIITEHRRRAVPLVPLRKVTRDIIL